jgi:hypothetical protein
MKVTIEFEVKDQREEETLRRYASFLNDPNWIASWWHIDDVQEVASDEELENFTDEEARRVLRLAKLHHDSEIGINWDVLNDWASYVYEQRQGAA